MENRSIHGFQITCEPEPIQTGQSEFFDFFCLARVQPVQTRVGLVRMRTFIFGLVSTCHFYIIVIIIILILID